MKRLFILGLMALLMGVSAPVLAKRAKDPSIAEEVKLSTVRNSLFYKALTAASANANAPQVMATLDDGLASKDPAERNNAVQWLKDNTFGVTPDQSTFNSFYFMYLSDIKAKDAITAQQLGKVDESNESAKLAVRALMAFEILANADAERCNDPSLTDILWKLINPKYYALKPFFKTTIDKEAFDKNAFEAIDTESRKSSRPLNVAICMLGDMPASPGYKLPEDTPDTLKVWGKKRADLRNQYKVIWSDFYYKLTDTKK